MDEVFSKLLEFPPYPPPQIPLSDSAYDDGIRTQVALVRKIPEKNLLTSTSGGESPLDVINPAINSVPYLVILLAYAHNYENNTKFMKSDTLWAKISGFFENFDGRQIRYLGKEYYQLLDFSLRFTRSQLNPSGSVFTTVHKCLAALAVQERAYNVVLPVIEKFILYVPGGKEQPKPTYICDLNLSPAAYITPASGHTSKAKSQDILDYFFSCGSIYIGLRRWAEALECLENCVTYPAKDGGCSKIMVEAYKRWVIVSVLAEGRLRQLPKTTSSSAIKIFRTVGKPYETVVNIFETGTAARLKAEVEFGRKHWKDECNYGIMKDLLAAYQKFQIRNLGQVYTKISIPEIHNQTCDAATGAKLPGPEDVEILVQDMLREGSLNATMNYNTSGVAILTFTAGGPVLSEAEMQRELLASSQRIQALTQHIKQTDRTLTHEKDYINYAKKMKAKGKKFDNADQGIGGDMDWNAMEDEELMTDLL